MREVIPVLFLKGRGGSAIAGGTSETLNATRGSNAIALGKWSVSGCQGFGKWADLTL